MGQPMPPMTTAEEIVVSRSKKGPYTDGWEYHIRFMDGGSKLAKSGSIDLPGDANGGELQRAVCRVAREWLTEIEPDDVAIGLSAGGVCAVWSK